MPTFLQSTDDAPAAERLAYWHEAVCRSVLSVSVNPCDAAPAFSGHIAARRADDIGFASFRSSAHVIQRSSRQAAALDDDSLLLSVQLAGEAWIESGSEQVRLAPGEFGIVDGSRAFQVRFPGPVNRIVAVLPRRQLERCAPQIVRARVGKLHLQPSIHALLRDTMRVLFAPDVSQDDACTVAIGENVCNLLASACAKPSMSDSVAREAERRRAAVLALVARRYAEPDFGAGDAARDLGVSVRSVHKALEGTGRSFGELLKDIRLDASRVALGRRNSGQRVIDVALACGFSDISHYNHAFRLRFGMTPGQVPTVKVR